MKSRTTQGILVFSSATIDNTNNFSNGVFTKPTTNGVCLRIENTQRFTTASGNRIENVSFPVNPGSGTINVAKTLVAADSVEFYNATGSMSGENFENDPNGLIFWTGPKKLTWTGAKNTNWYDVANWLASVGANAVPDSTYDVQVPFVTNQPIINIAGASSKSLRIESGAIVIVATPNDTAADLTIHGELLFEGILRTNTSNDEIEVRGNWSRVDGGNYSYGSGGRIVFANKESTLSLNNGSSPFYDLVIENDGNSVILTTDIVINNDLTINNGTLDVTTSNSKITIGGSFSNTGIFKQRQGSVIFTTASSDTINAGATEFYNLTMTGLGNLVLADQLRVTNIANVTKGFLNLNGESLLVGNSSTIGLLRVDGGILEAGASSAIKMAANASILISSGGKLKVLGTSLSDRALVTNQTGNNKYSFTISNGGVLEARFYTIQHVSSSGINFQAGSQLDPINNLSYGTLTNGVSGGTFVTFNNSQVLSGNNQLKYVEFPTNPGGGASNAKKTAGGGNVKFYYAIGVFQGEDFDNDPNDKIAWDADIKWTGLINSDWNNPGNWTPLLDVSIPGLIPTKITDVIIPDASTVPNNPVLSVNGLSDDLLIETNGLLTINSNANLIVTDSVLVNGILTIDNSSTSQLSLGGSWVSNTGTFNSGNNSNIVFTAKSGVQSISTSNDFCGVKISSAAPATGTIQTASPLKINCNLQINSGTLSVANAAHEIILLGNWENKRTVANAGFVNGNGTVVFAGSSNQAISQLGNSSTFYNLKIENSGGSKVTLLNNVVINNDLLIINNSTLEAQTRTLSLRGNWVNNNTTASTGFNESTGRVSFIGNTVQSITHAGGKETFNNVTINNSTNGTAVSLNNDVEIKGLFAHADGVVTTGTHRLILTNTLASSYSGWSNSTFVNGNLRRFISTNTSTYPFPIGKGSSTTDYFRIDMTNNNMTGLSYIDGSVASIVESGDNIDGNVVLQEYNGGASYFAVSGEQAIWTLTPNAPIVTGNYGIRAYIANISGLTNDLFGLVKRPSASTDYADWTDDGANTTIAAPGQPGRTVASGYAERTGWTAFSQFAIATTDIPLPIELLSFEVAAVGSSINVKWITLTEKNNDYFTIERSVDGINFIAVGKVSSKGNSLNEALYTFTDPKALSGVSYYRLRQTDLDGRSETFEIRAVKVELGGFSNIYPNPTADVIVVSSAKNDIKSISIYSLLGELVLTRNLTGENVTLNLSNLASGVYTVVTTGVNWVEKEALVITR